MHLLPLVLLPLTAQAINIVSSNDDGWAEINIRQFYKALTAAGHSVVVSAPAENQSGTGSSDKTPTTLTEPCEFNSCPSGSPATGYNASDPRLNYVNSYPVTSMKYGINTTAPPFFNGAAPALAVSGPNVGANLGLSVYFSGTVGAAHYASEAGIPAIAFSGSSGSQTAWNAAVPAYSQVYAQLATKVTNQIVASGTPYLPDQVWLNVNFPEVSDECASADDFKFVLSRIFTAVPLVSGDDVETCGSSRLPTETTVVDTDGCYVSISVGWSDKTDADADVQAVVLDKLGDLLWTIPLSVVPGAGPTAKEVDVQAAINAKFKPSGDSSIPAYEIREKVQTQTGRSMGTFIISFATPVKGLGKTLGVGQSKKVERPLSKEGGGIVRFVELRGISLIVSTEETLEQFRQHQKVFDNIAYQRDDHEQACKQLNIKNPQNPRMRSMNRMIKLNWTTGTTRTPPLVAPGKHSLTHLTLTLWEGR
ncbi:5'/3'-nucleotidase SurE [Aspergillus thermomutatus]|uniref:Survival protein SurE-like phosphatase/nucleotidase domain-containing protein n=1 Tax=Aspergillus thermomutatus TaxID=41047 RepID=A0A397HC80_ASPTH|nr:uncharacterized protein CDV56_107872 [Aspergillus thermomutatus]RHZ60711.1 hypothetical protein CDV56_107872 [Aspergillus thermomutatus]